MLINNTKMEEVRIHAVLPESSAGISAPLASCASREGVEIKSIRIAAAYLIQHLPPFVYVSIIKSRLDIVFV